MVASKLNCVTKEIADQTNVCLTGLERTLALTATNGSALGSRPVATCCSLAIFKDCLMSIDHGHKLEQNAKCTKDGFNIGEFVDNIVDNIAGDVLTFGCGSLRKMDGCSKPAYKAATQALSSAAIAFDKDIDHRKDEMPGIYRSLLGIFLGV